MDVKTMFLNKDLDEEILIKHENRWKNQWHRWNQMLSKMYGTKPMAARNWQNYDYAWNQSKNNCVTSNYHGLISKRVNYGLMDNQSLKQVIVYWRKSYYLVSYC